MNFSRVMSYLRLAEDSDFILACMVRMKPRGPGLLDRFVRVEKVLGGAPDYTRLPSYPWLIDFGNRMQRTDSFPLELFSEACDPCLGPLESEVLAGAIIDWTSEAGAALLTLPNSRFDRNAYLAGLDFDSFVKTH